MAHRHGLVAAAPHDMRRTRCPSLRMLVSTGCVVQESIAALCLPRSSKSELDAQALESRKDQPVRHPGVPILVVCVGPKQRQFIHDEEFDQVSV